jgi:hypothetical protein
MLNLKNTLDGYLKNVEVIGNTVQDTNNLANIRSVGDKVEGQELYNISIQVGNDDGVSEVVEILSPVQLEKVGDVADKIVCKDGVWGVEKNVETRTITGGSGENIAYSSTYDRIVFMDLSPRSDTISLSSSGAVTHFTWSAILRLGIKNISNNDVVSIEGARAWLQANPQLVKYIGNQPQFIPLPHDQQVKLRTFAGQTNIAFLTEIPGQIKAQVPKSLGATVNTHTEQIKDLHNSLDRVKKLEETTVSTVETGSSFTTVDATSNGYFEDMKLEGKTLVNLNSTKSTDLTRFYSLGNGSSPFEYNTINGAKMFINTTETQSIVFNISQVCETGKTYTMIFDFYNSTSKELNLYYSVYGYSQGGGELLLNAPAKSNKKVCHTFTHQEGYKIAHNLITALSDVEYVEMKNIIILEGDHTQNPPSYFEGLKSVGDGVDEIVVSSVNENLFDVESFINFGLKQSGKFKFPISLEKNTTYTFSDDVGLWNASDVYIDLKNKNDMFVCDLINPNLANRKQITFTTDSVGDYYLETYANNIPRMLNITTNFMLNKGTTPKPYTPHQSDKKRLLYYNEETQTWEKPILRQWDSIEKHSDGKYYYHKRSKEVVLNGSENWLGLNTSSELFNRMYISLPGKAYAIDNFVSDNFMFKSDNVANISGGGFAWGNINNDTLWFTFSKTLDSKSKWIEHLRANPTTLVYQLAQEEVYECTNIDLMTYSEETNYIVSSGAISPKSTLKVHNNISNVVKILQEKVNLLENTFIAGLRSVLSGDMYSLATILYPEDFEQNDNTEQDIMVIPE